MDKSRVFGIWGMFLLLFSPFFFFLLQLPWVVTLDIPDVYTVRASHSAISVSICIALASCNVSQLGA